MITKEKAYKTSDGKVHATLGDAQKAELEALFVEICKQEVDEPVSISNNAIVFLCDAIVKRIDRFKDILSTTGDSRPRARKVNRKTKGRYEKHISERTTEILDQAAADGIRRQNAKYERMKDAGFVPLPNGLVPP